MFVTFKNCHQPKSVLGSVALSVVSKQQVEHYTNVFFNDSNTFPSIFQTQTNFSSVSILKNSQPKCYQLERTKSYHNDTTIRIL
jgi:hypothetical protein